MCGNTSRQRIDKWLWVARFFKTRSLAARAVTGGRIQVDGLRARPSRKVAVGQKLTLTLKDDVYSLIVLGLSQNRGPAPEARLLYEETTESKTLRETKAQRCHQVPKSRFNKSDKYARRARILSNRLKRGTT